MQTTHPHEGKKLCLNVYSENQQIQHTYSTNNVAYSLFQESKC